MKHVLVVTGPSGVGKTYLARLLLQKYPLQIRETKLITTRPPRPGEAENGDRTFLSGADFQKQIDSGKVAIHGTFHNHQYGYLRSDVMPDENQHVIMNTWPALAPSFAEFAHSTIIGLTIDLEQLALLEDRMRSRGDSEEKIAERIPLIKQDIKDLSSILSGFRAQDKQFTIHDDSSLRKDVMPWIEKTLGLQA